MGRIPSNSIQHSSRTSVQVPRKSICTALKPQFFKVFACLSFMYLLLHCVLARLLSGKKGAIPSDGHQVADSAIL